jgi:hypothetical protein
MFWRGDMPMITLREMHMSSDSSSLDNPVSSICIRNTLFMGQTYSRENFLKIRWTHVWPSYQLVSIV